MKRVDLTSYASLVGESFAARVNLLEHAIGSTHFPSIGAYKERLLAKILRDYLPNSVEVGTGFVLFPRSPNESEKSDHFDELNQALFEPSKQCDIIVFDTHTVPLVFRDEDFVVVRPESVKAIIEVKGSLTRKGLRDTLEAFYDFGVKWRRAQLFYREHHQPLSDRPGLYLMAWQVGRTKSGSREMSSAKVRQSIASFYQERLSASEADGFPLLDRVLVHNDFEVFECAWIPHKDDPETFEFAQGWASGEGRFLRSENAGGELAWKGDKTVATLVASIHYQLNNSQFNRFFSYADEIRPSLKMKSEKDGFSPVWADLPSEQFRRINSNRLSEEQEK